MSMFSVKASADFTVTNSDGVEIKYSINGDGGTVSVSSIEGDPEKLVIPNNVTYDNTTYRVTRIEHLYTGKARSTKSVTIPKSITYIRQHAFSDYSNLEKVIIEDLAAWCNITTEYGLGSSLLTNAGHLYSDENTEITDLVIPNGVTVINSYAFAGCKGIKSVTIPNSVTTIGGNAFRGCTGLTSITIPGSVTSIEGSAFYNCSSLSSVNIGYGVTTIGSEAFMNCSILKTLSLSSSVTTIGSSAFASCSNLEFLVIPNGVATIGSDAFNGCTGLKTVSFGKSVKTIGSSAFSGCVGLQAVTIPNSVTSIGEKSFSNCTGLKNAVIGDGTTTIGKDAFWWCTGLTSITLGKNVEKMYEGAFGYCIGLKSISIPRSVTTMSKTFQGCEGLNSIFCDIEDPTNVTCGNLGEVIYSKATLYVPEGTTELYSAADGWKNFVKIAVVGSGTYTLTYKVDGEVYKTEQLATGDIITPAEAPEKRNYTFAGWMNLPERMPAEDIEVEGEFYPDFVDDANNILAMNDLAAYKGKSVVLPIEMKNAANITAFQFDLYLPEGITIGKDEEDEYLIDFGDRTTTRKHNVASRKQSDGAIRVVATSMTNAIFSGNEGTVLNITLNVSPEMATGVYDIKMKYIELSDNTGTAYNNTEANATITIKNFVAGDTDGNGKISVNDAVMIINNILGEPNDGFVEMAADLDDNGIITVNDVVILINDYILGGSSLNSLNLNFTDEATEDDDYLYIENIEMSAGEEREVEVYMNTSRTDIQGLQCDIYLPEGVEFVYDEEDGEKHYAEPGGRAARSHNAASMLQADGALRVVETSTAGSRFKENDQAVFTFRIKANDDMTSGSKVIKLANVELSYGGAPINPEDRTSTLTILDATSISGVPCNTPVDMTTFIYNLDGKQLSQPQKGVNILRMSDGTTRKIVK